MTAAVDSKQTLQASSRLPDPRVTAIKTAAPVCSSESDDTDVSNGAGSSSHADDSSPGSQSPPALERVERLADKDLSEDGVLIPPRPLAQWGVSIRCDHFEWQLIRIKYCQVPLPYNCTAGVFFVLLCLSDNCREYLVFYFPVKVGD